MKILNLSAGTFLIDTIKNWNFGAKQGFFETIAVLLVEKSLLILQNTEI